MFERQDEKPKKFAFDLEKEIKEHPAHGKKLLEEAEARILEIKEMMRKGADNESDYDKLGILLHANAAAVKVLKKVMK